MKRLQCITYCLAPPYLTSRLLGDRIGSPSTTLHSWLRFAADGVPLRHWPLLFPAATFTALTVLARARPPGAAKRRRWQTSRVLEIVDRSEHAASRDRASEPHLLESEPQTPSPASRPRCGGRGAEGPAGAFEARFLSIAFLTLVAGIASLTYQPVRYHLILAPPMAALTALGLAAWRQRGALGSIAAPALMVLCIAADANQLLSAFSSRSYSLVQGAAEVERLIGSTTPRARLAGRVVDTLALQNHLDTVNLPIGRPPETIEERLGRYPPTHLLLLDESELSDLATRYPRAFGTAERLGQISLLGDYYRGRPAALYRLRR